jgi:hypothetical protein
MTGKITYTAAQVAALPDRPRRKVTRISARERGVLILNHPGPMHEGRYHSIRIPCAVYERVIGRLTVD